MTHSVQEIAFMERAIALARLGLGRTSPNPCVGAVLVKNGRILGEGWHRAAGSPHAEVLALKDARRRKANVAGSTLYVTLEPCCSWGRTPPCTEAILAAGIRRVVVGATDPNPHHRGRGYRLLQKRGIQLKVGILRKECEELNRSWNHWMAQGVPWVIGKCGMTLDGKIATANGESRWITSGPARREAHRLRARVDAILVGVNTVRRDDPELRIRKVPFSGRQPLRIIMDPLARIPLNSRILLDDGARTWIMASERASPKRLEALRRIGANVAVVPDAKNGKGGLDLKAVLALLGKANITSVLVEGGGETLGAFFQARLVQEVAFFIAPVILGGSGSIKAVAGEGFPCWRDSIALEEVRFQQVGPDLMLTGLALK